MLYFKNISKTFFYYHCTKRAKYKGKAKFSINEKTFYITEPSTGTDLRNKLS